MIFRFSIILFSLAFGLLIYLLFRQTTSPLFIWVAQFGWADVLNHSRNLVSEVPLPSWFIYSLPDGLWMFAFILFMMTIWDFSFQGVGKVWVILSVMIGISFEICQVFLSGIGTFDWMDMIFLSVGALLPILLFTKYEAYEKVC